MKFKNLWGHFCTINIHKIRVMINCFRVGLIKQGLLHDLSKYSLEEFIPGVLYYQGTRSPNAAEREDKGFSRAWLHHKGRNKHHYEYWIDFTTDMSEGLVGHKMPLNYVIEMMMDRIAASKTYKGKDYTDASPWEYYMHAKNYMVIAPETRKLLEELLLMLKNQGEKRIFSYIRNLLKKGDY
jgi:hypothetical protein